MQGSAINISWKWEYQGLQGVECAMSGLQESFFLFDLPFFLNYTAYQTKMRNTYSNFFDQFYCIAFVPWLNTLHKNEVFH